MMTTYPDAIVLATHNAGKVAEIKALLTHLPTRILSQTDFGISPIEETGKTFAENALLKARHASAGTGLPALADDSGVAIDALNGAPGIHTARYAGPDGNAEAVTKKILHDLKDIPSSNRAARGHCVLAYCRFPEDPDPLLFEGVWEGHILFEPQGTDGFGFDSIFFVPTHGCSAAELPHEEKNRVSHRAIAIKKWLDWFHRAL